MERNKKQQTFFLLQTLLLLPLKFSKTATGPGELFDTLDISSADNDNNCN